jgi:hypothetical protein
LLSQAMQLSKSQLNQRINAATHLIYHALFQDPPPPPRSGKSPS